MSSFKSNFVFINSGEIEGQGTTSFEIVNSTLYNNGTITYFILQIDSNSKIINSYNGSLCMSNNIMNNGIIDWYAAKSTNMKAPSPPGGTVQPDWPIN